MTSQKSVKEVNRSSTQAASETFSSSLHRALEAVETAMHNVVESDVTTLRDASHHILEAGGKRVRPRLAMLSYAACGGSDLNKVTPIAAAIELMHTASVVHDDINDHGIVRRGRPSVNAIWGRTFALLTGDFLFTKVYELMAPYKDMNILLAEAAVALVEGETLQASAVKENRLSREIYYDIIGRKTAALFRAAGRIGAELAHGSAEQAEVLAQFAYNVGLAFQIIDDILDLTADTAKIGKTSGLDLAQGKGYAAVNGGNGDTVAVAETTDDEPADPMETIKRKILKGNTLNEAREQAYALVHAGIATLDILPESEAKQGLIELAHLVVEREY
jgi:octaprenyl-diphosphate synthase